MTYRGSYCNGNGNTHTHTHAHTHTLAPDMLVSYLLDVNYHLISPVLLLSKVAITCLLVTRKPWHRDVK